MLVADDFGAVVGFNCGFRLAGVRRSTRLSGIDDTPGVELLTLGALSAGKSASMHAAIFNLIPPTARLLLLNELGEPSRHTRTRLFCQRGHVILLIMGELKYETL